MPAEDLDQAGEDGCREQVFKPVLLDQRDHQNGGCRGRRRNHAGPAADDGGDDGNRERGVEADLGIDAGDDRKRDGFRDQREGDDEARENVAADVAGPLRRIAVERDHEEVASCPVKGWFDDAVLAGAGRCESEPGPAFLRPAGKMIRPADQRECRLDTGISRRCQAKPVRSRGKTADKPVIRPAVRGWSRPDRRTWRYRRDGDDG
jgi:hypothetical protein